MDEDDAWAAIEALQRDGDRVTFDQAALWLWSEDELRRSRGAAILGQLRKHSDPGESSPVWLYRDESFPTLSTRLDVETSPLVLESLVNSLGHIGNPASAAKIVRHLEHAEQSVRSAASFALGCFPDDPVSIAGLIHLTEDEDADVRDWAVFGLGVQGSADSEAIRTALLRRLEDDDPNTREEALVGLAKRKDARILNLLRSLLMRHKGVRLTEAAAFLLDLEAAPEEWSNAAMLKALNERFPNPAEAQTE